MLFNTVSDRPDIIYRDKYGKAYGFGFGLTYEEYANCIDKG
jgi:hypothetical protein